MMAKVKTSKVGAAVKNIKQKSGIVSKVKLVQSTKTNKFELTEPIAKLVAPIADMVREAFDSMKSSRKGSTLVSIRNYIAKKHVVVTKRRQSIIKKFIEAEFQNGRIKMANDEGKTINYTRRFKLIAAEQK